MSKKLLLVTAAAGVISFLGAFGAAWFTSPASVHAASEEEQTDGSARTPRRAEPPPALATTLSSTDDGTNIRAMTEEQLKELIFEVREKIQEYNSKTQHLDKEKQRLLVAQQTLKEDIATLNDLRVDLAAAVASLRNERETLQKTRVEIEQIERGNLVSIAAAYDKMEPARASEILSNMAATQSKSNGTNLDDAVKILFFMQDRTKAKVLAELATTEPTLAALLSQKLKHVTGG